MLSAVAQLTVTVCDESPLRVMVAVRFAAVSSEVVTSAIESVGVPSSSVIVTVPVAAEIAEYLLEEGSCGR